MKRFAFSLTSAALALSMATPAMANGMLGDMRLKAGTNVTMNGEHQYRGFPKFDGKLNGDVDAKASLDTSIDLVCMQTAVAKREASMQSAQQVYVAAWSAALTKRAVDLKAAWQITTSKERMVAIRASWKTFHTSMKAAKKTHQESHKLAWKTFRTDAKACRGEASAKIEAGLDVSAETR
jgi:hypothetical protein